MRWRIFFTYFQIYIKSIENLYKIYRTDLLSRKFHLGDLCMPRHKAFDNTMLIRLTSELKSSFNSLFVIPKVLPQVMKLDV